MAREQYAAIRTPLLLDEPRTGLVREERKISRALCCGSFTTSARPSWRSSTICRWSPTSLVIVLNHGSKIADGPPHEIAELPEVVVAYLGASRSQP
jgi:hypothetical protein